MTLNKLVSGKLFKLLTHAFWVIMGCCCAWISASEPLVGPYPAFVASPSSQEVVSTLPGVNPGYPG